MIRLIRRPVTLVSLEKKEGMSKRHNQVSSESKMKQSTSVECFQKTWCAHDALLQTPLSHARSGVCVFLKVLVLSCASKRNFAIATSGLELTTRHCENVVFIERWSIVETPRTRSVACKHAASVHQRDGGALLPGVHRETLCQKLLDGRAAQA